MSFENSDNLESLKTDDSTVVTDESAAPDSKGTGDSSVSANMIDSESEMNTDLEDVTAAEVAKETEETITEDVTEEPLDDNPDGADGKKADVVPAKKGSKKNIKKIAIVCTAIVVLIGIILLLVNVIIPNKTKADTLKQINDTKSYKVSNLECQLPASWDSSDYDHIEEANVVDYITLSNGIAEIEVAYNGETLDGVSEELNYDFGEGETIDQGSVNVKNGTGKYSVISFPNGNTTYIAPIKVDDSVFTVIYSMKTKCFELAQAEAILNNIAFDKYVGPTIESIRAEYKGSTEAETQITKDTISGLTVYAKYKDGSEKDITVHCKVQGDNKLAPNKTSKLEISFTDWNNKTHKTELSIKCTSTVKSLSAKYNGSREGGTKISKGMSDLKVKAKLDNGKTISIDDYEIDGPQKLQAGTDNNYTISYSGVSTTLTIKGKKSVKQVAESIIPGVKSNKYVTVEWFSSSKVYFEKASKDDEYDGYLIINTWLDSGVYNYLSMAQTGSEVGLTYEEFLLLSSNFCSDVHDDFADEGYDKVAVYFYVWPPGVQRNSGTKCYSLVSDEGIQRNPFVD